MHETNFVVDLHFVVFWIFSGALECGTTELKDKEGSLGDIQRNTRLWVVIQWKLLSHKISHKFGKRIFTPKTTPKLLLSRYVHSIATKGSLRDLGNQAALLQWHLSHIPLDSRTMQGLAHSFVHSFIYLFNKEVFNDGCQSDIVQRLSHRHIKLLIKVNLLPLVKPGCLMELKDSHFDYLFSLQISVMIPWVQHIAHLWLQESLIFFKGKLREIAQMKFVFVFALQKLSRCWLGSYWSVCQQHLLLQLLLLSHRAEMGASIPERDLGEWSPGALLIVSILMTKARLASRVLLTESARHSLSGRWVE